MQFRDLQRQYKALQPQIDAAMQEVAASAAFIGGKPVRELEQELAAYVGTRHCVSCANGTDALTLALKVWGIGTGDAVFVPDFTFFASAETVAEVGASPVFVDVDAATYNIDTVDLQRKVAAVRAEGRLTPKVIVTVDLFGLPAHYAAIRQVADAERLLVLEDGAQGFGGSVQGRRACSFGDIATTSFFPAKPLGCYGDGGALFTDDDEWAALAESLKVHGRGTCKYDNVRIGMNSRLDTLQAAILRVKLRAFEEYELAEVNRAAARYTQHLHPLLATGRLTALPLVPEGYHSSWAQYTIQLPSTEAREALQMKLKAAGIPSMVYYPTPMHAQTAFATIGQPYGPCPTSDRLCHTVLSLPIHPYLTDEEILHVTDLCY